VRIDESHEGKTVELAPGQKLLATLDANPTTGFDWAVIKAPAGLGSPEMGYVSSGNAPGAPGKRHLTWSLEKALPAGEHAVELAYARSFEKGVAPFKTYRFKVRSPR
jgi:predicted secreted protein